MTAWYQKMKLIVSIPELKNQFSLSAKESSARMHKPLNESEKL
ncbi:hypothetical protein ND16A_3191 [Thalassotalea sp. ND16A]|nr:hypothetical protein ND16A_3191 [Thalassotalea sp. ND16A]